MSCLNTSISDKDKSWYSVWNLELTGETRHWAQRLLMLHVVDLNQNENDNVVHFTILFRTISKLKIWFCIAEIHKSENKTQPTNILDPHSTIWPVCNNLYQKLVCSPKCFDSCINWKFINMWPIPDYLNANQICGVLVFHI